MAILIGRACAAFRRCPTLFVVGARLPMKLAMSLVVLDRFYGIMQKKRDVPQHFITATTSAKLEGSVLRTRDLHPLTASSSRCRALVRVLPALPRALIVCLAGVWWSTSSRWSQLHEIIDVNDGGRAVVGHDQREISLSRRRRWPPPRCALAGVRLCVSRRSRARRARRARENAMCPTVE